ncbi:MAG: hypothetical protein ACKOKE_02750 [Actinomycetota bacterium]
MERNDPLVPPPVKFSLVELFPDSTNAAMLVEIPGDPPRLAVYKPEAGERPLHDFPQWTLCRREVAASLVAETLGFPFIPTTRLVLGPIGVGALSDYVEYVEDEHYFTLRDRFPFEMQQIAAFDAVTNNADRKGGHVLHTRDGRIMSIDHGLCFHVEPKLRTVIWDWMSLPVPEPILEGLRRLDAALGEMEDLRWALLRLLRRSEVAALRRRVRAFLAEGRFPLPEREPIYPWPPI